MNIHSIPFYTGLYWAITREGITRHPDGQPCPEQRSHYNHHRCAARAMAVSPTNSRVLYCECDPCYANNTHATHYFMRERETRRDETTGAYLCPNCRDGHCPEVPA